MKPMIIFQLNDTMQDSKMQEMAKIIAEGFREGSLIVDNSVTILSFDENGNMNYCTRHEGVV